MLSAFRLRLFVLLTLLSWPTPASANVDADFERAKNAFTYGDYKAATTLLDGLLNPRVLLQRSSEIAEALELLGIASHYQNDRLKGREAFVRLLTLAPEHRLDPLLVPPPVIEFFESIRLEMRRKLNEIREKQRIQQMWAEAQRAKERPSRTILRREVELPFALNFVPFGVPQFSRGDTGWGSFFLISQLAALGTNIGAAARVEQLRGDDGFFEPADAIHAESVLQPVQITAFAVLLALTAWGVLDGVLRAPEHPWLLEERIIEEQPAADPTSTSTPTPTPAPTPTPTARPRP